MRYCDFPTLPLGAFQTLGGRQLSRLYFGGGGGGESSHYENLEKLYDEQAQSAKLLREQAEKYLPGVTDNYAKQVNKVLDDGYAERQADIAGADMANANAMERSATTKELASMGVNPADRRYATAMAGQETTNAARMAAGKNAVRNEAEQMQRAVAQDAVGTFTGQSNNAASQLSSATSGLSGLYGQQAQQKQAQAAQTSNNVGAAVGGTMAAGSLMNWWKDGGEIKAGEGNVILLPRGVRQIECHMLGGAAGSQQNHGFFSQGAVAAPASFSQQQNGGGGIANMVGAYQKGLAIGRPIMRGIQAKEAGAGMDAAQARAAADAYESAASNAANASKAREYQSVADSIRSGAGVSRLGPEGFAANQGASASQAFGTGITETTSAASQAAAQTAGTEAAAAGGSSAASAFSPAAASLTEAAGVGEAAALGSAAAESGMAMAGAGASGAAAAGTGAAAGGLGSAGAAIGTALPWVGAAMAAGSLLGLFADGGEVGNDNPTKDYRDGDKVEGPGSHTDDLVPALLSDGEHVINAEAAAIVGHSRLEKLNQHGLKMRSQGITPRQIKTRFGLRRASTA